jgi:hypothetical protein
MAAQKASEKVAQTTVTDTDRDLNSEGARRAYEHFGRIEILEGGLAGSPFVDVSTLANLAQQQLDSGRPENAANLLRAAEHLSFAALAPKESSDLSNRISPELKAAVARELERLTRTAEDRWTDSEQAANRVVIKNIFAEALDRARQAFTRGAYRPALQLARAADALSQVAPGLPSSLPGDRELTRRLAS